MISLENYKDNPELVIGNLLFKLNERVFLKTELDVVYSDLVNWERSNLLNIGGNSDKGDWKRLNYFEYIWVKIIQELRVFGFSYEEIDNYKSELMIKPNIKEIIEASKIDFQSVEEQITLNNLKSIEDNGSNEKIDLGISYFELMISRIIGSGEKWSILFFKDIPRFYFPLSIETLKGFDKIGKTDIP
jgi:hypothetical protein